MILPDYLSAFPRESRTLFGLTMDDTDLAMGRGDWLFIDYVLSRNKTLNRAVELGTFRGLTSLYLGICMALRGGGVTTIDRVGIVPNEVFGAWNYFHYPYIEFEQHDVIKDVEGVSRLITPKTLLVCDNGEKDTEAKLYAPYIQKDAIMMVHDKDLEYDSEVLLSDMERLGLSEDYKIEGEALKSSFMVFRRIE